MMVVCDDGDDEFENRDLEFLSPPWLTTGLPIKNTCKCS